MKSRRSAVRRSKSPVPRVSVTAAPTAQSALKELDVQPGEADAALGFKADWNPGKIFTKNLKEGSWAAQHGLVAGSELCALNGQVVSQLTHEQFIGYLKGRPLKISFRPPTDDRPQANSNGYPVQRVRSPSSSHDRRKSAPLAPPAKDLAPEPKNAPPSPTTSPLSLPASRSSRRRSSPRAPSAEAADPVAKEALLTASQQNASSSPGRATRISYREQRERRRSAPLASSADALASSPKEAPSPAPRNDAAPSPTQSTLSRYSRRRSAPRAPSAEAADPVPNAALPTTPPKDVSAIPAPANDVGTPPPPRSRQPRSLNFHREGRYAAGSHAFADDEEATAVATSAVAETVEPEAELCEAGPLKISTRLEYTSLKVDMAYNVFGLVTLQAAEAKAETEVPAALADVGSEGEGKAAPVPEQAPVDITCVLDVSGSMRGAKIQLLKDAVMFVISELGAADRLSLVTFESHSKRHTHLARMSETGKDTAQQATMRLLSGGGTNIAAGLDCGIAVMEQRRQRNPVGAIFLLTDGQDRGVHSHIPGLVARARAAQAAIYTFGFGSDHDASTMSTIAECAQTPFTFVERLDNIREAFAGAVSGIMSVVAQNIDLTIEPLNGIEIAALHTHFAQRHVDGGAIVVSIPDAFEGERRDVVVELRVPAASAGGPVLKSRAAYKAVRERGAAVHTPPVLLEVVRSEEPEAEPDEEVVAQRERVQVADALETAIARGEDGNFEEARSVLEEQVQKLQRKSMPSDTSKALLSEVQDAQRRLSSASSWSRGGRAEVADRAKMHKYQRCTNLYEAEESFASCVEVSSKSCYATSRQKSAVKRSKASASSAY